MNKLKPAQKFRSMFWSYCFKFFFLSQVLQNLLVAQRVPTVQQKVSRQNMNVWIALAGNSAMLQEKQQHLGCVSLGTTALEVPPVQGKLSAQ